MAILPGARSSFATYDAFLEACRRYARETVPPFQLTEVRWKERDYDAARVTCASSPRCDFLIEAHKMIGEEWVIIKTKLIHAHWLPASGAPPQSLPAWTAPIASSGFGHHRWGSDPSTTSSAPAWTQIGQQGNSDRQRGRDRQNSIDEALLAAVAAVSPVNLPGGEGPPAPAVGSTWKGRDAFKAACAAHGAAARPHFGFTTIGSNNTSSRPFLIYACRHFGSRQDLQCPYFIRLNGPPQTKPDDPWCARVAPLRSSAESVLTQLTNRVVVDACYRHEKHRPVSPPPRKGAWTVRERPLTRGPRKPKDPNAPLVGPDRSSSHKRTTSGSSSDASMRHAGPYASSSGHAPQRWSPESEGSLQRYGEPVRRASPVPMVDASMPLPMFIASLHPLLGLPGVADSTTASLRSLGIDDLATLLSLTPAEITELLSRLSTLSSAATTAALSPAQIAVLGHRLGPYLPSSPSTGSPHQHEEALPDALSRLHAGLFRPDSGVVDALRSIGIVDTATLRLLERAELSAALKAATCTEAQKVVLAFRVHLL